MGGAAVVLAPDDDASGNARESVDAAAHADQFADGAEVGNGGALVAEHDLE